VFERKQRFGKHLCSHKRGSDVTGWQWYWYWYWLHYGQLCQSTRVDSVRVTLQMTIGLSVSPSVRLLRDPWPDFDCSQDSWGFACHGAILPVERTGLSCNRSRSLSVSNDIYLPTYIIHSYIHIYIHAHTHIRTYTYISICFCSLYTLTSFLLAYIHNIYVHATPLSPVCTADYT